jgi:tetratricopeptide (TPR) repeat protein
MRLLRLMIRRVGLAALLPLLAAGCGLNAKTQNAAGVRMYQQGFYQGAQQRFQQAIYNDPMNADSYYNMAATLHKIGRVNQSQAELDQAESFYNQCLDHSPNHRDCYRGLAVLLSEQGRSEEAFRLMQGWCMRSPALPDAKIELARLHQEGSPGQDLRGRRQPGRGAVGLSTLADVQPSAAGSGGPRGGAAAGLQ